jgi:hypothetical protein
MPINADKPHFWKADTRVSVDQFNQWFMKFSPKAYRDTRKKTIESVEQGLTLTKDLTTITPDVIKANPGILPTLRMSTCPPLARDRLIGLSDSTKNFVGCLEEGKLPPHLAKDLLDAHLKKITAILSQMLGVDIFPWIAEKRKPSKAERYRSSTIVADRLCGAVAEPIVRNAQEKRQLALIENYLTERGYKLKAHPAATPLNQMEPGTFSFRLNVLVKPTKVEAKTSKPVPSRMRPDGSGTTVVPCTVTEPPVVVLFRIAPVESCRSTLEIVKPLVPDARAVKSNNTSVPFPEIPGIAPSSVSTSKVTLPVVLLIVPGMKKVDPPPDRKVPSRTFVACTTAGLKLRSNWKS